MHHSDLLKAILEVIQEKYAEDISIMFIYGSFVHGMAHEDSDLDMIYVPKTERGKLLARTFMLNGTGNDLWGVSWERLERYASYSDMKISVLAESRLVYYASDADRQRYETLKKSVTEITNGPLTPDLIKKAEGHLNTARQYYGELCLDGGFTAAGGILYKISDVLCLLNHTYLRFGVKRMLEELSALERQPLGLSEALRLVIGARNIEEARAACGSLIKMIETFLQTIKREVLPWAAPAEFAGVYEEISAFWNKIRRSSISGDALSALLAATSLQDVLDDIQMQLGINLPELRFIEAFDPLNLNVFAVTAQRAEDAFVTLLQNANVPINSYNSVAEFKESLLRNDKSPSDR